MSKKIGGRVQQKILSLWTEETKEKLISYKEIVYILKNDGISERTVARYLLTLVNQNKLDKIVRGYKKTFYQPSKEFWENFSQPVQQFQITEESLKRIGTYVINTLTAAIVDAEETTKQTNTSLWEKISSLVPDNKIDDSWAFTKAMDMVLNEKDPTEEEKKELHELVDSLIKQGLILPLSNPTVFARLDTEKDITCTLQEDIWGLVKSFMAVWTFLYKHPQAVREFEKYLQKMV